MLDWEPAIFTVGQGHYITDDTVARNLNEFAKRFGVSHKLQNIGATWFGSGIKIYQASVQTMFFAELMNKEWWDDGSFGTWGKGLYRGVLSMYASQIAVNQVCEEVHKMAQLDASCTEGLVSESYSIHFWHTFDDFSKIKWHEGGYTKFINENQGKFDTKNVVGYIFSLLHFATSKYDILQYPSSALIQ